MRAPFIDLLNEVCFEPYVSPPSSLFIYIRTQRIEIEQEHAFSTEIADVYFECTKRIGDQAIVSLFEWQEEKAKNKPISHVFLDEMFSTYQSIGQQTSDLLSVIPHMIDAKQANCIFMGGRKHIPYIVNTLTQNFGFHIEMEKQTPREENCVF